MASDEEEDSKTEAASERRLQQAFENGDIALSRDLPTAAALMAGAITLAATAGNLQGGMTRLVAQTVTMTATTPFATLPGLIVPVVAQLGLVLVAAAAAGLATTFVQTRAYLWTEKAEPDLSRVFSLERLTRTLKKDFWVDLGISVLKAGALGWVAWTVLRDQVWTLARLLHAEGGARMSAMFGPLSTVTLRAVALVAAFAAVDYVLARRRWLERHKMTKDELKREMKEDEGDPLIRGARKRRHREIVRRNALAESKKADVLIVNPTHIAIAVRYRKDQDRAPRVLAKGKGVLAEAMREVARSSGIPIIQDIPLARLLFKKVKSGGTVPADTYKAVAAVLAVVYRMTQRTPTRPGEVRS